jgi:hypothetical protein
MKMHIRKLLALVLFGLSLSAAADFTTITAAYEIALSDLRLPGSATGTVTFKECADCDAKTVRVTGQTSYMLNDRYLELTEFKARLGKVRNRKDETATVLHHLESNTITAIKVRL